MRVKPMLIAAAMLCCSSAAWAAPPAGFDKRVDEILKASGVPGIGIAIVEQGQPAFAKGYGVRKLGAPETVNADTIFPTGSTGKAMTSAALAVLVDRGRIGWDDKVIDHLRDFQMYDAWVTREMTIRDLLVHRSGLGLGAGDLLFVPDSTLDRAESVRRLRYIKPATSFRSGYAYDNVLYMVAGQLIEAVTGQTWEKFTQENVLNAAGMKNSVTDDDDRFKYANRAQPHARTDGAMRGIGTQAVLNEREGLGRNAAPAGGISVSPADMAKWLQVQLAHGALPDGKGRVFSEAASTQMWLPQVLTPISQMPEPIAGTTPQFQSYALGWDVRDYKGHKIVWHGGAVFGYKAIVVLVPEKNVGFSVLINSEDGAVLQGLLYELLDHYLGLPKKDWFQAFTTFRDARVNAAQAQLTQATASPAKVGPALPIERYAGKYRDPWYGEIDLKVENGKLVLDFHNAPGMVSELEPFQYETFRTKWRDRTIEDAYVTFGLTAEGAIERITMKPISPLADFSYDYQDLLFTPVPAKK